MARTAEALSGMAAGALAGLDRLTCLAAELLEVPLALLSLVDAERQVLVSSYGLPEFLRSSGSCPGADYSVCQQVVDRGVPFIVGDLGEEPEASRSSGGALATESALQAKTARTAMAGIRSCAGMPVVSGGAYVIGALCVADYLPRDWTHDKLAILADLAALAAAQMGLEDPGAVV